MPYRLSRGEALDGHALSPVTKEPFLFTSLQAAWFRLRIGRLERRVTSATRTISREAFPSKERPLAGRKEGAFMYLASLTCNYAAERYQSTPSALAKLISGEPDRR